ncbi:MAG: DUF1553 domain-containing protein [Armatimonadetes bacterium]|nr:DUF1553 domain-containing protein [Armatimonadota bacterium]
MRVGTALLSAGCLWFGVAVASPGSPAPAKVDFSRDVLPILSEKCFKCHGPDSSSRQAGLRLDTFAGATAGKAVVPGNPDASLVLKRVTSKDSPMPPVETGKHVTPAEADTLRRWIAEGAKYAVHWAFLPVPQKVSVPKLGDGWAKNDIDRFVFAKLQANGLKPTAEAPPERITRRVSLDLTGLPPDNRTYTSYTSYVDQLLASPAFGERMAVEWLDAARYSDSYGYQSDLLAPFWPYRDWVVRAFNANMHYDEFLAKQLAGDLLPNATTDDRLATAFNRLHRQSNEGGSIPADFKNAYAVDRVETFGTAVMGLTVGCARCHDHKYDPITQREFYQLYSYFNSINEFGLLLSSEIVPTPSVLLPTEAQKAEIAKWKAETEKAKVELAAAQRAPVSAKANSGKDSVLRARFEFGQDEGGKFPSDTKDPKVYAERIGSPAFVDDGSGGKALQLTGDDGVVFRGVPARERYDAFTWGLSIKDPRAKGPVVLLHRTGGTDVGFCGFDLMLEDGYVTARVMRTWPGNALAIRSKARIPKDAWVNIGWVYDGSGSVDGMKLYFDGERAAADVLESRLWKKIAAYGDLGPSGSDWSIGQRFRDAGFRGGAIRRAMFIGRATGPAENATLKPGWDKAPGMLEKVAREAGTYGSDPAVQVALKHLREAQEKLTAAEEGVLEVESMEEAKTPTPTYVLFRGMYDAPVTEKDRVVRDTPKVFPPLKPQGKNDRLALARWATRKDNPLTARVFVNRIWQMLFGTGLVETSENFGVQGSNPTHPELLDYLARRFMDSGWDIKGLVKEIVTSATYRQDSTRNAAGMEKDPQNKLLWHGPSMKLSAEMVRDTALSAAGLLNTKMGGPPVNPYQPAGIWTENNTMTQAFVQSKGADLYRRSLYSTVKRTTPVPSMLVFDGGSRESCIVRRPNTSTPLQALVLMNDVQFVEAARVLAERVMKSRGTLAERVDLAYSLLAGRSPDAPTSALLRQTYDEQYRTYTTYPAYIEKLLAVGDKKPDPTLDKHDLAAMTVMCQAILNSDAVVWKR